MIAAAIMKFELAGLAETQLEKEKYSASHVSCLCWTKVWAPNPLKQWKEINDTDDDKPRDQISLYLAAFTVHYIHSSSFMLGSYIGIILQVFFSSFPKKRVLNLNVTFVVSVVCCKRDLHLLSFVPGLKRLCAIRVSEGCLEPSAILTNLTSDVISKLD